MRCSAIRLRGDRRGSFTTVMLASMEAIDQVARPEAIVVNDLNAVWSAATRSSAARRPGRRRIDRRRAHDARLLVASAVVADARRRVPPVRLTRSATTPRSRGCIEAAADAYRVPPAVLVILLNVEGGSLGAVSQNTNGTVDIGPMQVNQIWVPQVAAHWRTTERARLPRRCATISAPIVEAGAWILRQGLDEAHGDFWEGVGFYHSHDPGS